MLKLIQHGVQFDDQRYSDWEPDCLDIYCRGGGPPALMASYLEAEEGYVCETVTNAIDTVVSLGSHSHTVCTIRLTRGHGSARHINVIASISPCSTHPLPNAWNTALMAFVSANGLTIPYPALLRQSVGFINPLSTSPLQDIQLLVQSYELRGLRSVTYGTQEASVLFEDLETRRLYCPHNLRSYSDAVCWHVPFASRHRSFGQQHGGRRYRHQVVWKQGGPSCSFCEGTPDGVVYLEAVERDQLRRNRLIRCVIMIRRSSSQD